MGNIHELIEQKGRQEALQLEAFGRQELDTAIAYLSDEDNGLGYLYSGWCQAALPHRRLPDEARWVLKNGNTTLIVSPGVQVGKSGDAETVGIPYGSRARLILIYLQSEAIRTQSREIELGRSLRVWMGKMGISIGGDSTAAVRDQADRIARCSMTFEVSKGQAFGLFKQNIVDAAMFEENGGDSSGSRFVNKTLLSEAFYAQLKKHPVPLEESALKRLSNNSMGLDVYAWLAYRLHSLSGPTAVPWKALMAQFGGGFGKMNHFRPRFLENLRLALAVYPEAKVDIGEEGRSLTLHPSRPPVAKVHTRSRVLQNPT
jgi:Plasmid encoded RepA protein